MYPALLCAYTASLYLAVSSSDPTVEWISKGGVVGILAFAVVAFLRGWIVSAAEHKRVLQERDQLASMIYKHASLSEKALDAAMERLALEERLTLDSAARRLRLEEDISRREAKEKT